jgi:hypothetical protein
MKMFIIIIINFVTFSTILLLDFGTDPTV